MSSLAKALATALLATLWAEPADAWVALVPVEVWPVTACITSARLSEPSLLESSWEISPLATLVTLGGALWVESKADSRSGANWVEGVEGAAAVDVEVVEVAELAELDWASPAESVLNGVLVPSDEITLVSICWSQAGRGNGVNPLIFMKISNLYVVGPQSNEQAGQRGERPRPDLVSQVPGRGPLSSFLGGDLTSS